MRETGQVRIRFYQELSFFLPAEKKKKEFYARFHLGDTVKALIESLGVPHTEVDLILVNQESVSFEYRLRHGDRISVYPTFESFDIASISRVRPTPLREIRFILDVHLGRLAQYLRMVGFDTLYTNTCDDGVLSSRAQEEQRILLTRDRDLLKRKIISHGYYIRSRTSFEQLAEVIRRFDLADSLRPFTLCLRCNIGLTRVDRKEVTHLLPATITKHYQHFSICPKCLRIYWRGSHWEHMRRRIDKLLSRAGEEG